ncbi:hypothetical protein M758_4G108000 [Ceratodon purpureus]|nr:hypothetical protein M758_4G108000 [Ceratodon purpureus]
MSSGFTFMDQGIPAYEVYVRQLFVRVHQLLWPISGVLPFYFASHLLVEALGIEVNWADYASRTKFTVNWPLCTRNFMHCNSGFELLSSPVIQSLHIFECHF